MADTALISFRKEPNRTTWLPRWFASLGLVLPFIPTAIATEGDRRSEEESDGTSGGVRRDDPAFPSAVACNLLVEMAMRFFCPPRKEGLS
jgi:hypothetical protein